MKAIVYAIVNRQKIIDLPKEVIPQLIIFITNNLNKNHMDIVAMKPILYSIIFSLLGIIILLLAYVLIEKITPENTWKKITQENNTAVALVFAALIIGISMIISAAIHG